MDNLPIEVSSFVGRREATAQVRGMLSGARLVTLTGVAGVGKTRLALHVAEGLRRTFPDGTWVVELAKLQEPSLLSYAVGEALGLHDTSNRDPQIVLMEYLAEKRLLLVFDNCEHLLDGCARLVSRILSEAPAVHVIATSREPLEIAGEHLWSVPPLDLPDLAEAVPTGYRRNGAYPRTEALALFEDRATAVLPDFRLDDNERTVAQLCQRLDGLPLAIELAAVRMRTMSAQQILERLESPFRLLTRRGPATLPHHQSLQAAVAWSFDLCTAQEKTLWSRLSVFPGRFDLEAAEQVCSEGDLAKEHVFDALTGLVDKSVLVRNECDSHIYYTMLEAIRQFGRERLTDSADAALRRRHRDYYLGLAQQAECEWFGPWQVTWSRRMRGEYSNLLSALEYSFAHAGEPLLGMRFASRLWFFWISCGFLREGRYWLDRALASAPGASPERIDALWVAGYIATRQGEISTALTMLDEARQFAQQRGDDSRLAHVFQAIGLAELFGNFLPRSIAALEQALAYHRSNPDWPLDSHFPLTLFCLSFARCLNADVDGAVAVLEECRAVCEASDERWCLSWALWGLSLCAWVRKELPKAAGPIRECLRIKHLFNDVVGILLAVELLAWIDAESGEVTRAAVLLGSSRKLWKPLGTFLYGNSSYLGWHEQCEQRIRRSLGDAALADLGRRGSNLSLDQTAAYALGEEISAAAPTAVPDQQLTKREWEIAELITRGLSNKDIASELVISRRTVDCHVQHILAKLDFGSRAQIAAWITEVAGDRPDTDLVR